jgi:TonB family protein
VVSKTIEFKKPNLDDTPSDAVPDFSNPERAKRPPYVLLLVALCVLVVGWVVVQGLSASPQPTPVAAQPLPPPPDPVESEPTTLVREMPEPLLVATAPNTTPHQPAEPANSAPAPVSESVGIHEEIPDVPLRARRSIRGHVKVTVRLIVDKDGSVFAALVDEPGPSKYFERVAMDAAKKWTFPAVATEDSRLELVQFDFTPEGATGHAVAMQ